MGKSSITFEKFWHDIDLVQLALLQLHLIKMDVLWFLLKYLNDENRN